MYHDALVPGVKHGLTFILLLLLLLWASLCDASIIVEIERGGGKKDF